VIKVSCGRYFQVVSGVDTLVLAHFAMLISRFIGHRPPREENEQHGARRRQHLLHVVWINPP